MDEEKTSLVSSKVNDEFFKWAEKKYGSDGLGNVSVTRGKTHDYLGTILDWTKKNHVSVSMKCCQEAMVDEFLEQTKPNNKAPWRDALLTTHNDSLLLSNQNLEMIHALAMKDILLVERIRQDLEPRFRFLSSRARASTQKDW